MYFCDGIKKIDMLIALSIPVVCILFLGYMVYSAPEVSNEA